jgi:ribosome biogenesis protein YTM1
VAPKACYTVSTAPEGGVVAVAGADKAIRLWDPRQRETAAAAAVLSSHTNWVNSVAWVPDHAFHLWSASHDCSVKLWDIRGKLPLHSLACHTDKVLGVAPHARRSVASGGADNVLRINQLDAGAL